MRPHPQRVPEETRKIDHPPVVPSSGTPRQNVTPTYEIKSQRREDDSIAFFTTLKARDRLECVGCGHPFAQHTVNRLGQDVCTAWNPQRERFCECNDFAW